MAGLAYRICAACAQKPLNREDEMTATPALLAAAKFRSGWAQMTQPEREAVLDHYKTDGSRRRFWLAPDFRLIW